MQSLGAICSCDLPIVGAMFSSKKKSPHDDVRGCGVDLAELPHYRKLFNTFPDRLLLEGWQEVSKVREGIPHRWLYVPESHTVWVSTVMLDLSTDKGQELWAYGTGFYGKDRRIAVRETMGDKAANNPEKERVFLTSQPPEYLVKAVERQKAAPAPRAPRQSSPRAITASGEGGGSSGTAVTKMTAEERAEYKARLLAKAVLTDRDKRHLARIEKLGG